MAKIDLSQRDRHAIKWHLNVLTYGGDRTEERMFDHVFDKLKLDDVASKQNTDPDTLDVAVVTYELESGERDFLIDQMSKPGVGFLKRIMSPVRKALVKSRDGDGSST